MWARGHRPPHLQRVRMAERFASSSGEVEVTIHRGFELFGEPVPMVGRDELLGALESALDKLRRRKQGRSVALIGPEGIGKTRVLYELAQRAEHVGATVYRARAGGGQPRSGRLAAQLLRQRLDLDADLAGAALRDALRAALEAVVPGRRLGDAVMLFAQLLGTPTDAPLDEVQRLYVERAVDSVVSLLRRDAAARPHVVIADRVDEATAEDRLLLERLVAAAGEHPVLLALAAREERALGEAISTASTTLPLAPFDKREARELARAMLRHVEQPPKELVVAVAGRSRGVPGAMEQILRTLAAKGIVDTSSRPWSFRPDRLQRTSVPASVEDAARQRIDTLDDRARGILEKAAVVGERFWFGAVLAVMRVEREAGESYWVDDRKRNRLNRILLDLQSADFVQHVDDSLVKSEAEFTFQNQQERKLLAAAVDDTRRRLIHRLTARWMRRVVDKVADPLAWNLEIASHERAGGRPVQAAEALLEAARVAHRLLRHDEALEHLRGAASMLDEDEGALRYDVQVLHGEVARLTGNLQEAVDANEQALYESVVLDDKRKGAQAYVRLGQALAARGAYGEAAEMVRRARALFHELNDTQGIADALDELGRAMWLRGAADAYKEALTHFLKALALRRRIGDPQPLADSLTNLARLHLGKGYCLHARGYLDEALEIHERTGNRWGRLSVLIGMGATWHESGESRRALEIWGKATALAEEIGDRQSLCILLNNLGEAYLAQKDHVSAQVYLKEAQEIAAEVGDSRVVVDAARNEALGLLERGEVQRALLRAGEALDEAVKHASNYHVATCRAALARVRRAAIERGLVEETADAHREVSEGYNEAISVLERMGDDLQLARVLRDYGGYLQSQGVERGNVLLSRAAGIEARQRQEAPDVAGSGDAGRSL